MVPVEMTSPDWKPWGRTQSSQITSTSRRSSSVTTLGARAPSGCSTEDAAQEQQASSSRTAIRHQFAVPIPVLGSLRRIARHADVPVSIVDTPLALVERLNSRGPEQLVGRLQAAVGTHCHNDDDVDPNATCGHHYHVASPRARSTMPPPEPIADWTPPARCLRPLAHVASAPTLPSGYSSVVHASMRL